MCNRLKGAELGNGLPMLLFDGEMWWLLESEEISFLMKILENDLRERLSNKTIYIWGKSTLGEWIYNILQKMEIGRARFIDIRAKKGEENCLHPKVIQELKTPFFIIASWSHQEDIKKQLIQYGFKARQDFQFSIFQDFSMQLDSHELTLKAIKYAKKNGKEKGNLF